VLGVEAPWIKFSLRRCQVAPITSGRLCQVRRTRQREVKKGDREGPNVSRLTLTHDRPVIRDEPAWFEASLLPQNPWRQYGKDPT
jgi:hypothetical protein